MKELMCIPEFMTLLAKAGVEFVGHRGYCKMTKETAEAYVNQCLVDALNDPFLNHKDDDGEYTFVEIYENEIPVSSDDNASVAHQLQVIFNNLEFDQFYGNDCIKALPLICSLSKSCSVLAGYYSRFAPVNGEAGMGSFASDLVTALERAMSHGYGPLLVDVDSALYFSPEVSYGTIAKFYPFLVVNP